MAPSREVIQRGDKGYGEWERRHEGHIRRSTFFISLDALFESSFVSLLTSFMGSHHTRVCLFVYVMNFCANRPWIKKLSWSRQLNDHLWIACKLQHFSIIKFWKAEKSSDKWAFVMSLIHALALSSALLIIWENWYFNDDWLLLFNPLLFELLFIKFPTSRNNLT